MNQHFRPRRDAADLAAKRIIELTCARTGLRWNNLPAKVTIAKLIREAYSEFQIPNIAAAADYFDNTTVQ